MTITKVRAIYFTGTGNTGKTCMTIANKIAEALKVPCEGISVTPSSVRRMQFEFKSDELAVIGTPTYAGRVPNLILPFFEHNLKGENTPTIAVCTFGNRAFDDCLVELRNTLQNNGFMTIGAGAFVGQHVFAPMLGRGRPGLSDVRMMSDLSKKMIKKLEDMKTLPEKSVYVAGNDPVGPYYTPRDRYGYPINIIKVRPKTDRKKCSKCGVCIKMCPMDAISPDPNQVPGPCIKCGLCFKVCPTKAKYYDDENFLFHKKELESQYGQIGAKSEIFF